MLLKIIKARKARLLLPQKRLTGTDVNVKTQETGGNERQFVYNYITIVIYKKIHNKTQHQLN